MPNDVNDPQGTMIGTEKGVRNLFVISGVGMVSLIVAILILATARPQGNFEPLDDSQYQATLESATEDLEGFELVGEDRARIDIRHAIELVAERGVDLALTNIDAPLATMEAAPEPAPEAPAAAPMEAGDVNASAVVGGTLPTVDGETVFTLNCVSCHQATGAGLPGAFPPLSGGHAAELANAGGRGYMIRSLIYGLQGAIEVQGMTYMSAMPAWPQLTDEDVAAVLNYIVEAWDNGEVLDASFEPFTIEEVTAARGEGLAPTDVLNLRPALP